MSVFLKIKIKNLAAEAKIIRQEERKNGPYKAELADHRRGIVRRVARDTQVAYGFLRGRAYKEIEPNAKTQPNWKAVQRMVENYFNQGRDETDSKYQRMDLQAWIKEGLM